MNSEDLELQLHNIKSRWTQRTRQRQANQAAQITEGVEPTPPRPPLDLTEVALPDRDDASWPAPVAPVRPAPAAAAAEQPESAPIDVDDTRRRVRALVRAPAAVSGVASPRLTERAISVNDMMSFAFLSEGGRAGRCVGCIKVRGDNGLALGYGSGFLISPRLVLTNNHVLKSPRRARYSMFALDWVLDRHGRPSQPVEFGFAPDDFFFTHPELDFTVVAVQPRSTAGREIREWGHIHAVPSAEAEIGERVNIIQHPGGQPKQVALRANRVVDLPTPFVHYQADTAQGSSGAPVFNDAWELVALHHLGVPRRNERGEILTLDQQVWRPDMGEHVVDWVANEGILLAAIVEAIRATRLPAAWGALWDEAIAGEAAAASSAVAEAWGGGGGGSPGAPTMVASPNGVTVTVPLSVTLRLGAGGLAVSTPTLGPPPRVPGVDAEAPAKPTTWEDPPVAGEPLAESAKRLAAQLEGTPGIVRVRPGWVFADGWITKQRAIVVEVEDKKSPADLLAAGEPVLGERFAGHRIEVVRRFPGDPDGDGDEVRNGDPEAEAEGPHALGTEAASPITYRAPDDLSLTKVEAPMVANFHVSPDAGWPVLDAFLRRTKKRLVVAMYDFTAPHILDTLLEVFAQRDKAKLELVIQRGHAGGGSPKVAESDALQRLGDALGNRFKLQFAGVKGQGDVWRTAYHIKVAVRDGEETWLSSGNWQTSGQPEADPIGEGWTQWKGLNTRNREWNAVLEHKGLAETFEGYIRWDRTLSAAEPLHESAPVPRPDLFVPEAWFRRDELSLQEVTPTWFPPLELDRSLSVQPLLTPDNYWQKTVDLIRSAQTSIRFQNQTLSPKPWNQYGFYKLLATLRDKQEAGLDVRIIFRDIGDTRRNLEKIADFGFDMDHVKVLAGCHTKGIVVDDEVVLLGSHNWSEDGTLYNRDASLIVHDAEVARYFAQVFDWDWEVRARQKEFSELFVPTVGDARGLPPPGHRRIAWDDFFAD